MLPEKPAANSSRFGAEVLQVCRLLEQWRAEEKRPIRSDPNEFPETNWRVMAQALFFFGAGGLVILTQSWLRFAQGWPTLGLYVVLLATCEGAGLVLFFHALRIFTRQFWRAAFSPKDNYPFSSLILRTERELSATEDLDRFSDAIVQGVQERLSILEGDLRERLTLLGGNSAVPTVLSLATAVWSTWKSWHEELTVIWIIALAAAVGILWMTAFTLKLRFSLLELTRCRALLSLELARRKASVSHNSRSISGQQPASI